MENKTVLLPSNVAKVLGVSSDKAKISANSREIDSLQKEVDQLTAKATLLMKKIKKLRN